MLLGWDGGRGVSALGLDLDGLHSPVCIAYRG